MTSNAKFTLILPCKELISSNNTGILGILTRCFVQDQQVFNLMTVLHCIQYVQAIVKVDFSNKTFLMKTNKKYLANAKWLI